MHLHCSVQVKDAMPWLEGLELPNQDSFSVWTLKASRFDEKHTKGGKQLNQVSAGALFWAICQPVQHPALPSLPAGPQTAGCPEP